MNSIVTADGTILFGPTVGPEPASHKGLWVPHVVSYAPTGQIADGVHAEFANGVPVRTVPTFRDKTADELRKMWSALDFRTRVESIAPGAWKRLREASATIDPAAEMREQAMTAQEVISDDPRTLQFMGGAVQLGILTQKQADEILNGQ